MEEKGQIKHPSGIKTIQETKEESKYYHNKSPKNRLFFNSVTGEEINLDYDNEEDMYTFLPYIEEYSEDKIANNTDLNEKDKIFFHMWNNYMNDKNISDNYKDLLIEFLKINYKTIFDNDLKKNFMFHIVIIYENRQISEENIINIIEFFNKLYKQYQEEKNKKENI